MSLLCVASPSASPFLPVGCSPSKPKDQWGEMEGGGGGGCGQSKGQKGVGGVRAAGLQQQWEIVIVWRTVRECVFVTAPPEV